MHLKLYLWTIAVCACAILGINVFFIHPEASQFQLILWGILGPVILFALDAVFAIIMHSLPRKWMNPYRKCFTVSRKEVSLYRKTYYRSFKVKDRGNPERLSLRISGRNVLRRMGTLRNGAVQFYPSVHISAGTCSVNDYATGNRKLHSEHSADFNTAEQPPETSCNVRTFQKGRRKAAGKGKAVTKGGKSLKRLNQFFLRRKARLYFSRRMRISKEPAQS